MNFNRISTPRIYFIWVVTVVVFYTQSLLTGEYLYRMQQVVDYIGTLPAGVNRENLSILLMALSLITGFAFLLLGSFLVNFDKKGHLWARWPLALFCLITPAWMVSSTLELERIYFGIVDYFDYLLCASTVICLFTVFIVSQFSHFQRRHGGELKEE